MREFVAIQPQLPLIFDNHGPTPVHATQFSPADVVESSPAPRPRLHPELEAVASRHVIDEHHVDEHHIDEPDRARDDGTEPPGRHHPDHYRSALGHDHHGTSARRDDGRDDGPRHEPTGTRDDAHHVAAYDGDRAVRALLRLDHDERRRERGRRARRTQWRLIPKITRRPGSAARTPPVDARRHSPRSEYSAVRFAFLGRRPDRSPDPESNVPTRYHRRNGSADRVDTHTRSVRTIATGPLQGVALALYFVLLPYVVETKWRFSYTVSDGAVLRDLLVGLGIFWLIFLILVVVYVHQLRHRRPLPANGCAWLAGLIIVALPFLVAASADASVPAHRPAAAHVTTTTRAPVGVTVDSHAAHAPRDALSGDEVQLLTLALATKGRRDRLRHSLADATEEEIDQLAREFARGDANLIGRLREVVGSDRDGEVRVTTDALDAEPRYDFDPVAVALLGPRSDGFALGYAREGGALPVDLNWSDEEIRSRVVALHDGGVVFAQSDNELFRALARRRDLSTLVVYLGDPEEIDDDLRELYVGVRAASGTAQYREGPPREVRVELLRAFPRVGGLVDDFTPSLRRRCTEMVAYLAMHRGEPVTGERLRTRVLVHAHVDASKTTLTNTASCVRRSLGTDAQGYLLEPVSSGLYHLRGVSLDVADFHQLVARSRYAAPEEAYGLYVEALRLVHGEPLASVLKGFEWFSFEGHRAQLQRDGEWVARSLHDAAIARDDVETAFWALRQGLLLDPDSDELLDALQRVPRLGQFRGDGTGSAQHHPVSPGRAVAMSWAFERFGR